MATPRDKSLLFISLIAGMLCAVHGWEVQASASEVQLGQNATFRCDLTMEDDVTPLTLSIGPPSTDPYYSYVFIKSELTTVADMDSRYSYDIETRALKIHSVECVEDNLSLECGFTAVQGTSVNIKRSEATFTVKVAPSAPLPMTTNPANLTGGLNEGESISATCIANVGKPDKGRIQWRVYRSNGDPQIIDGNYDQDGLTVFISERPSQSPEPSCSKRKKSEITFSRLEPSDQDLVLACFVINEDFPTNPSNCDSPQASLCQQSETIRIHYSVRNITLDRYPQSGDIDEGQRVTLSCQAKGFPVPRYEWSRVGDNGTLDGSGPELVFNRAVEADSGNYSCKAINVVNGKTHLVQAPAISINVVKPPPTTSPDPTESTDPVGPTKSPATSDDSSDDSTTIIIIVVVLVVAVVIAVIVGICIYRKRQSKEDPPRPKDIPFYNNKQTMGGPPDVLGDDKKKPIGGSLNNSFDMKNEDGLMYADLTYDNRPRSRKPMAIGDTSSEYSDVQMPQV